MPFFVERFDLPALLAFTAAKLLIDVSVPKA
jgi:hypothetical protein